eukprot:g227.t1
MGSTLETRPVFEEASEVKRKPNPLLWGAIQRPFPTNAWWTPSCLENGQWTIHPLPYHIQPRFDRAIISYPDYMVSETFVNSAFVEHICIGCEERFNSYHLSHFDSLSVKLRWETAVAGQSMESTLFQGSPYFTAIYTNATPMITSVFAIAGSNFSGIYTGYVFKIPLNNGQSWMLYASKDITLRFHTNPCIITATAPFTGVLRVALVPPQTQAASILDKCQNVYPISGTVHLDLHEHKLSLKYEFKTECMGSPSSDSCLLMMALTHHQQLNVEQQVVLTGNQEWYRTIKGPMFGICGDTWTMTTEAEEINWWNPEQTIDPNKREVIRGALYVEVQMSVENTDVYAFGKRLAALGRLAIIADELGEIEIARVIRKRMKEFYSPWLKGQNSNPLLYDPFWGGIISTHGTTNKNADFGSGMYNDHHFQYGYFLYAAAVIGKEDKDWIQKHRNRFLNLARDYANPSTHDNYFPHARHFDYYLCHSWASGLFCFPDGKNQESSSEAIHSYYALSLLGQVLDYPELATFGRALCSLEIISTQNYWHIPDLYDSPIYPAPFSYNAVVGIIWNGKVDYSTWFGQNLEYIHCIQMIPFVPISQKLLTKEWIAKVIKRIGYLLAGTEVEPAWRGYIWMAVAVVDKETAWNGFKSLEGKPDLGNSVTNALYWIATRPSCET